MLKLSLLVMGFLAVFGIFAGYYVGSSEKQKIYAPIIAVLHSERDAEAVQNLKALTALRENRVRETLAFMQMRLRNTLKAEGISDRTIAEAKDYQRKYCKSACLGVDD